MYIPMCPMFSSFVKLLIWSSVLVRYSTVGVRKKFIFIVCTTEWSFLCRSWLISGLVYFTEWNGTEQRAKQRNGRYHGTVSRPQTPPTLVAQTPPTLVGGVWGWDYRTCISSKFKVGTACTHAYPCLLIRGAVFEMSDGDKEVLTVWCKRKAYDSDWGRLFASKISWRGGVHSSPCIKDPKLERSISIGPIRKQRKVAKWIDI